MHDLVPICTSIATTVRVLPDVIDISIIPTFSGAVRRGRRLRPPDLHKHPDERR
jgi:hypothetical protein